MAQPIETAATVADDYDAICRVVQLCLDGESTGSVEKLREAFHEDARMFGSLTQQVRQIVSGSGDCQVIGS